MYLSIKHIISDYEHGLMNLRFTINNLTSSSQYLYDILDNSRQVSHKIFLQKLSCMDFKDTHPKYEKSDPHNRKQYVNYDGFHSNLYSAIRGSTKIFNFCQ